MPNLSPDTLFLKSGQVAQLLSMHVSTVNRLAQKGLLKVRARTPGGYALFDYDEVVAYRQSLRGGASQVEAAR